ncbi:MAG: hypothetical protein WC690_06575, partial [bacterium]
MSPATTYRRVFVPKWTHETPAWYRGEPHWSLVPPLGEIFDPRNARRKFDASVAEMLVDAVASSGYRTEEISLLKELSKGRVGRFGRNEIQALRSFATGAELAYREFDYCSADAAFMSIHELGYINAPASMIDEGVASQAAELIASHNWLLGDVNLLWGILSEKHGLFEPAALLRLGGFFAVARSLWNLGLWSHASDRIDDFGVIDIPGGDAVGGPEEPTQENVDECAMTLASSSADAAGIAYPDVTINYIS